jgi:hypothetical protein
LGARWGVCGGVRVGKVERRPDAEVGGSSRECEANVGKRRRPLAAPARRRAAVTGPTWAAAAAALVGRRRRAPPALLVEQMQVPPCSRAHSRAACRGHCDSPLLLLLPRASLPLPLHPLGLALPPTAGCLLAMPAPAAAPAAAGAAVRAPPGTGTARADAPDWRLSLLKAAAVYLAFQGIAGRACDPLRRLCGAERGHDGLTLRMHDDNSKRTHRRLAGQDELPAEGLARRGRLCARQCAAAARLLCAAAARRRSGRRRSDEQVEQQGRRLSASAPRARRAARRLSLPARGGRTHGGRSRDAVLCAGAAWQRCLEWSEQQQQRQRLLRASRPLCVGV